MIAWLVKARQEVASAPGFYLMMLLVLVSVILVFVGTFGGVLDSRRALDCRHNTTHSQNC